MACVAGHGWQGTAHVAGTAGTTNPGTVFAFGTAQHRHAQGHPDVGTRLNGAEGNENGVSQPYLCQETCTTEVSSSWHLKGHA